MNARFKLSVAPYSSGDSDSKFEIDGEKLTETVGGVTNEYEFIDNVIILKYNANGLDIVAKFEKVTVETIV